MSNLDVLYVSYLKNDLLPEQVPSQVQAHTTQVVLFYN